MRQYHLAATMLLAAVLSGCGGGGAGSQAPKVQFTSQVSFGDSLSDVGSYAVSTITAYGGGGQYTINGTGKNWTELMAAQLGLPAPCAYKTGLNGSVFGVGVTIATHPGCTGYAQGGARITNPYGPGNVALGGANALLGQLTEPITTQIGYHGSFTGSEIVFVMAGANDIFIEANTPATAGANVVAAATDLAASINDLTANQGAKYVVVVNVPDIANTPMAISQGAAAQGFFDQLVNAYNSTLQAGLANNANVLLVDAYTVNRDQINNPAAYGLTNVDTPACNLTAPTNPIGSSLMCNSSNVITGVAVDHYLFADGVHPTPYGYLLLARLVSKEMLIKGWL